MTTVSEATLPAAAPVAPPPTTNAQDQASLDRSFLHSIAWTGAAKWTGQITAWLCTIVVARILTPEDYGIVGMASVFLGLITILSEFGVGGAVITLRALSDEQVRQLHSFATIAGFACFLLAVAAATPMSRFFDTPELVAVVPVMGLGFILAGLKSVPDALLQRELQFRRLALVEGGGAILMALSTVAFAMLGLRYWTLVLGTLFGALISTVCALWLRPTGFARPRMTDLRGALTFGRHLVTTRLSWYAYSNADLLIAGKLLGQRALGQYNLAWSLASAPVSKISTLVMRVTPAYFSALQNDIAAMRRYMLNTTRGLAILTFPAAVGLGLVADDFVILAMGEKWSGAIGPLRLLALYASLRSITPLLSQILANVGETQFVMRNSILAALTLPFAFLIGSRWGTVGIAASWMIAHPLVLLPLYRRVFERLELKVSEYLRVLMPAALGCLWLTGAVLATRWFAADLSIGLRFGLESGAGAAAYGAVFFLLYRHRFDDFRGRLKRQR